MDATSKVALIPQKEVSQRVDYKVVSTTASQGRKIKRLTKKTTQKLIDEYLVLQKKIVDLFKKFKCQCYTLFKNLMKNVDKMVKESPEKLDQLL